LGISAVPTRPVIVPGPEDKKEARVLLKSHGVRLDANPQEEKNAEPIIGIHPGGKWDVKRWPTGHFAGLIDKIKKKRSAQVVLLTGPDEAGPTERLVEKYGAEVVRLPPLPVRTVAAVLSEFDAAVACDGGVMHLSVAVGTPTVGIFGSSEPEIWFPYEPFGPFAAALVPLDCRPCHQHLCPLGHTDCLNKLLPDLVLEKLTLVMDEQENFYG
jgi:ADP-heptose:LPS heptosyltransferase